MHLVTHVPRLSPELHAGGRSTPTIVVFARPGDVVFLGAFGLAGLTLRVDLGRNELVDAGPMPAAQAAFV